MKHKVSLEAGKFGVNLKCNYWLYYQKIAKILRNQTALPETADDDNAVLLP